MLFYPKQKDEYWDMCDDQKVVIVSTVKAATLVQQDEAKLKTSQHIHNE